MSSINQEIEIIQTAKENLADTLINTFGVQAQDEVDAGNNVTSEGLSDSSGKLKRLSEWAPLLNSAPSKFVTQEEVQQHEEIAAAAIVNLNNKLEEHEEIAAAAITSLNNKLSNLDLNIFEVVSALPTSNINENKVYLVPSSTTGTQNAYTEYKRVNNDWEKLGEYKSDVDLTEYAKNEALSNYLPLAGGTMLGTINSQNILPKTTGTYNLGNGAYRYSAICSNYFNAGNTSHNTNYGPDYIQSTNGWFNIIGPGSTTANEASYTELTLGNGAAQSSTNKHSEGVLNLYSAGTQYHSLKGESTNIAYSHKLRNASGYLVQTSGTSAVGSSTQPVYINANGEATACNTFVSTSSQTLADAEKSQVKTNLGIKEFDPSTDTTKDATWRGYYPALWGSVNAPNGKYSSSFRYDENNTTSSFTLGSSTQGGEIHLYNKTTGTTANINPTNMSFTDSWIGLNGPHSTTANEQKTTTLAIGNSNSYTTTDPHSAGCLRLYGNTTGSHTLRPIDTSNSNYNHYLPNTTGENSVLVSATLGTAVGSSTQPVYINANGEVVTCNLTSLPANGGNADTIDNYPIQAAKYLYHDIAAFCNKITPKYYTSANGTTFTEATLDKELFSAKDGYSLYAINDTIAASRWEWDLAESYLGCNFIDCIAIGWGWSSPTPTVNIQVEFYNGSAWRNGLLLENQSTGSNPIFYKLTSTESCDEKIRITISKASGSGTKVICSLKLLTKRWGAQGLGSEYEKPYQTAWLNNQANLAILPWTNNTTYLGSTYYKWAAVHANNLYGNLDWSYIQNKPNIPNYQYYTEPTSGTIQAKITANSAELAAYNNGGIYLQSPGEESYIGVEDGSTIYIGVPFSTIDITEDDGIAITSDSLTWNMRPVGLAPSISNNARNTSVSTYISATSQPSIVNYTNPLTSLTFSSIAENNNEQVYYFTTASTGCTVSVPSSTKIVGDLETEPDTSYVIAVLDGIVVMKQVETTT